MLYEKLNAKEECQGDRKLGLEYEFHGVYKS